MEVPTVIGLGLGFDGTSNWINKHLVDRYLFGLDEFRPEAYSIGRKFIVMWTFLTIFTLLLYFSLCPLVYYLLYTRRKPDGKNFAAWDQKEGQDQVVNEIKLSIFSIIVMAGMTAPFELLVEAGLTKIYWVRWKSTSNTAQTRSILVASYGVNCVFTAHDCGQSW